MVGNNVSKIPSALLFITLRNSKYLSPMVVAIIVRTSVILNYCDNSWGNSFFIVWIERKDSRIVGKNGRQIFTALLCISLGNKKSVSTNDCGYYSM